MSSTPHGGRLLNLIASSDEAAALAAKAAELPSVTLSQRDLSDVEMLGIGAFSPLDGFMTRADYEECVQDRKSVV